MSLTNSPVWMSATAAGFYDYEIDNSLRITDNDAAQLSRTPSSNGNQKTWTWSAWIKRGKLSTSQIFWGVHNGGAQQCWLGWNSGNTIQFFSYQGSTIANVSTQSLFRDTLSWYHLVVAFDAANTTMNMYVNGVDHPLTFHTAISNTNHNINNASYLHGIGRAGVLTGNDSEMYIAEVNFVDGQALGPTNFGETKNDIWVAKEYTGSYGTNGFYLKFQDSSALGDDSSGNNNDYTPSNLSASDQRIDSPTNNRPTFNFLTKDLRYTTSLTECNRTINFTAGNDGFSCCPLTIFRSEGKAYCEFELDTACSSNATDNQAVCVFEADADIDTIGGGGNSKLAAAYNSGSSGNNAVIYDDGVSQGNPTKFTTAGQRVGVYIDYDAGKGWFSHDGTVQTVNGTPDIPAGTNPHFTFTANTPLTVGAGGIHSSGTPAKLTVYDDPNDWETTPPSGYTSFSTNDLADPGVDPAADETPGDYFNTVLWTGDGASSRSISGYGFAPDFIWAKQRSQGISHALYDSVRGAGSNSELSSNGTAAEGGGNNDQYGYLSSFDSDGFTAVDGTATPNYYFNENSQTFVGWGWKAGGTAVSNTDGSITSSVSANTDAGFSIVSYTGNGTAGATVGHGLGKVPSVMIVKGRSVTGDWVVYHKGLASDPETDFVQLNASNAVADSPGAWNDTAPTSTVFSLGTFATLNTSSATHVAYCFAEIDGFSKFGSYTGNGSSDGPFVYTDFRPKFVIIKRFDSANNWVILDTARDTDSELTKYLATDSHQAEGDTIQVNTQVTSFGFKLRSGYDIVNANGANYIYLAFADQPAKYANAS